MLKKNISDGVGSQNESIDTLLYPPLFWLDNIFKGELIQIEQNNLKTQVCLLFCHVLCLEIHRNVIISFCGASIAGSTVK